MTSSTKSFLGCVAWIYCILFAVGGLIGVTIVTHGWGLLLAPFSIGFVAWSLDKLIDWSI